MSIFEVPLRWPQFKNIAAWMNAIILLVPTISFATEKRGVPISCRSGFTVESIRVFGALESDVRYKGKFQYAIKREPDDKYVHSTIAYTVLDPKDPVSEVLKEAYFRGLEFEVCMDGKILQIFDKNEQCQTCSARGEIQGMVQLITVGILAPLEKSKYKEKDFK